jgi:hypothetical protein
VNAFIGFCTPMGDTWPTPLLHLDYKATGIEAEITVTTSSRYRKVVPELICASASQKHALCMEAKHRSFRVEQAQAYVAITPQSLYTHGWIPASNEVPQWSHDIVYATSDDHAEALCKSIEMESLDIPMVSVEDNVFVSYRGSLSSVSLDTIFGVGIDVNRYEWPRHLVRFQSRSHAQEMVPSVLQALLRFVIEGKSFTIEELCSRAIDHWGLCGSSEQKEFRKKLTVIVEDAIASELRPYLKRLRPHRTWEMKMSPPKTANQYEKLQVAVAGYTMRIEQKIPFKPGQPTLLVPEAFEMDDESEPSDSSPESYSVA